MSGLTIHPFFIEFYMQESLKLIQLCLDQNQKGYELFFKQYYSFLYKVCYLYIQDNHLAKDLVQESFIKIFNKLSEFNSNQGPIEYWIKRIAINVSIDYLRSTNRKKHLLDKNSISLQSVIEMNALDKLELNEILKFINELKYPLREVILLHTIEGFSHKEISEILSISEEYSRLLLFESRKLIKKNFKYEKGIYRREF